MTTTIIIHKTEKNVHITNSCFNRIYEYVSCDENEQSYIIKVKKGEHAGTIVCPKNYTFMIFFE